MGFGWWLSKKNGIFLDIEWFFCWWFLMGHKPSNPRYPEVILCFDHGPGLLWFFDVSSVSVFEAGNPTMWGWLEYHRFVVIWGWYGLVHDEVYHTLLLDVFPFFLVVPQFFFWFRKEFRLAKPFEDYLQLGIDHEAEILVSSFFGKAFDDNSGNIRLLSHVFAVFSHIF